MHSGKTLATANASLKFSRMSRAAVIADEHLSGGEPACIAYLATRWEFGLDDPIGATLVVDETAGSELCDGKESSSL
jgi:hypothetical protein